MRIFVDGSESFWRPENHTGIQRVVREVCRRCVTLAPEGAKVRPVQYDGRAWGAWEVVDGPAYRVFAWARRFGRACRSLRRRVRAEAKARRWLPGPWLRAAAAFLGYGLASAVASAARLCMRRSSPVEMRPGDVLLLMDYPLYRLASIEAARARGVRVIALIYDCIPLSHPQFYQDNGAFRDYFNWVGRHAEGVMTISRFSADELRRWLPTPCPWVEHFPLGADLPATPELPPASELSAAFSRPCFLMVSTISPHKNHAQALDAMELLWAEGVEANLLLIGKPGWSIDRFLARISTHPERGRRFFVLHDVDDAGLAFAYRRAHALIAPSYVEGFGLPLIEALGRGLPVVAADIPVFREIVGDAVDFFPLDDAPALAAVLRRSAAAGRREVSGWKWPDWQEATRVLLEKLADRVRR